jgi:hypothetical protein
LGRSKHVIQPANERRREGHYLRNGVKAAVKINLKDTKKIDKFVCLGSVVEKNVKI